MNWLMKNGFFGCGLMIDILFFNILKIWGNLLKCMVWINLFIGVICVLLFFVKIGFDFVLVVVFMEWNL